MKMRKSKLGRGVAVVGAGMSRFGSFPDKTSRDLFVEAFSEAVGSVERGIEARDIQAIYVGNYSSDLLEGQGHLAPIMADWVGLAPKPATRVECACASGGVALRQAIVAIASGLYDIVLVGGVEKMTNLPTEKVSARILGVNTQKPEEIEIGAPFQVEFVDRGQQTFLGFKPI